MLIRGQDKESVVNFDNVYALYLAVKRESCVIKEQYETEIMCSNGSMNTEGKLGTYSSEEKADKVLDMIQDAYARCESVRTLTSGTSFEISKNFRPQTAEEYSDEHRKCFVFQMPQDDEVTI